MILENLTREEITLGELPLYASECTKVFKPGDVIVLVGDIGAGKTTFVSLFCKAVGIKEQVISPTFAIVAEYQGTDFRVIHIDTYRLEHVNEIFDLGIENLFSDDAITMIEWGERIEELLDREHYRLTFDDSNDEFRNIKCELVK